jgi:hypothetical protein
MERANTKTSEIPAIVEATDVAVTYRWAFGDFTFSKEELDAARKIRRRYETTPRLTQEERNAFNTDFSS